MPPSSGELWGHHLMPANMAVDCLLPNGIILTMTCNRDSTLDSIKTELWRLARAYPLFSHLLSPTSYIFISVTQDAETEEFYDETRRLCDLRLFQPLLKVIEPRGNKEEKMLNSEIGIAIGMPVNEFNEVKDLEIVTFRRDILSVCECAFNDRNKQGSESLARYVYPPDLHNDDQIPPHIFEKLNNTSKNQNLKGKMIICIWVLSESGDRSKYCVKVSPMETPSIIIAEAIRRRTILMNMKPAEQLTCIHRYQDSYLLKICGCDQFLLENCPISQYKHIRRCISRNLIPQLMLMSKDNVLSGIPASVFSIPSYAKRGSVLMDVLRGWRYACYKCYRVSALLNINKKSTISLWSVDSCYSIKINGATYVNIREHGKIYVKTGVYQGTEPLCQLKETSHVDSSNPCWSERLTYDLFLPDIPRSARLCVAICCVARRKKKETHYSIAWGNVNLFDFNNHLRNDKISLALWPIAQGFEDTLNPIGVPGSNPSKDTPCLDIEFKRYSHNISFPGGNEISRYLSSVCLDPLVSKSTASCKNTILEQLKEIISRDPLAELSEQDKQLLWTYRRECSSIPSSLPKLLASVEWNKRDYVTQVYALLKFWPHIKIDVALELLYCTYTDYNILIIQCLEKQLSDDQLSQYLLQLVQVLKFEPYIDNSLTRFLLRRALLSQRIGHFFFWHLKSEMHQDSIRLRFGLILEAYCRGCGPYLKSLVKQVEALEKLTKLTDSLKMERDENQQRLLTEQIKQADYLEALQNFPSPLNNSLILGDILLDQCDVKLSKKRPLWLVWRNNDKMAQLLQTDFKIIFKNGDDLRQDMLTLQVIGIMDSIWQSEGLDLKMMPYGCLSTGHNVGLIQVVRDSKTVMKIIKEGDFRDTLQVTNNQLHKWIRDKCIVNERYDEVKYNKAIESFTSSCAGYCVATFILGIGDRHPDNIMVNEEGQVFHIDFGHFLNHRKKKFGFQRERVPFILTEHFIRVIAKGNDKDPLKSDEFIKFMELCGKAYLYLRTHTNTFITLFTMMLSCGIPELQSLDDLDYLRKTLGVDKTEQQALEYFQQQFHEAYGGAWTTKLDWFFHWVKNR